MELLETTPIPYKQEVDGPIPSRPPITLSHLLSLRSPLDPGVLIR
jgi:hypothetical protein